MTNAVFCVLNCKTKIMKIANPKWNIQGSKNSNVRNWLHNLQKIQSVTAKSSFNIYALMNQVWNWLCKKRMSQLWLVGIDTEGWEFKYLNVLLNPLRSFSFLMGSTENFFFFCGKTFFFYMKYKISYYSLFLFNERKQKKPTETYSDLNGECNSNISI